MPEPMRLAAERTAEKERIEQGLITVREVLGYLALDRYLNLAQAAEYTSMSKRTLRDLDVPCYRVSSKLLLFKKSELDEWMLQFKEHGKDKLDELVSSTLEKVLGD